MGRFIKENIGELKKVVRNRSGIINIEITSKEQIEKLRNLPAFNNKDIMYSTNDKRNTTRGIIRSYDLACCSEEEILEELKNKV